MINIKSILIFEIIISCKGFLQDLHKGSLFDKQTVKNDAII